MQAIIHSFLLVAASEMGDKTQLLALLLIARFKTPWPIMAGILVATLANHALAAVAGGWVASAVPPRFLHIGLALVFFAFAVWILIPDRDDGLEQPSRFGPFITTTCVFFLAEMGDKTQLATVALGANYRAPIAVTIGTTAGMLLADGLAVFLGERLTKKIPLKWVRVFSCVLFSAFGIALLFRAAA